MLLWISGGLQIASLWRHQASSRGMKSAPLSIWLKHGGGWRGTAGPESNVRSHYQEQVTIYYLGPIKYKIRQQRKRKSNSQRPTGLDHPFQHRRQRSLIGDTSLIIAPFFFHVIDDESGRPNLHCLQRQEKSVRHVHTSKVQVPAADGESLPTLCPTWEAVCISRSAGAEAEAQG